MPKETSQPSDGREPAPAVAPCAVVGTLDPPDRLALPLGSSWDVAAFVWGVWALMLAATFAFVWQYGPTVPMEDDWTIVPYLTRDQPVSLTWLWDQQNEHRIPLPKIVLLALYRITRCDFRAGMFFNVLALAGLAATLIAAARRLRGWTSYADAFFPLLLLHWGQCGNLLWSFEVQFVSSTVLAGILLSVIVRVTDRLTLAMVALAGACLLLLPLCGANGVALVPALALWFGYSGVTKWHSSRPNGPRRSLGLLAFAAASVLVSAALATGVNSGLGTFLRDFQQPLSSKLGLPGIDLLQTVVAGLAACGVVFAGVSLVKIWSSQPRERFQALLMLVFASLAVVLVGLYFRRWGRPRPYFEPVPVGWGDYLRATVQFLTGGFGPPAVQWLWPFSGVILVSLLLLTAALAVVAWRRQPQATDRTVGLLFFCGGMLSLALGIAWGRASMGPEAFEYAQYYSTLAMPLACCLYFLCEISGQPIGRLIQMSLFAVACVLLPLNGQVGLAEGASRRERMQELDRDLWLRVSPSLLAEYHSHWLCSWSQPDALAATMRALQRAGIEPFASLRADPATDEVLVPVRLLAADKMTWDDGAGTTTGADSCVTFALDEPRFAYAIRLQCSYPDRTSTPALFRMYWKTTGEQDFTDEERNVQLQLGNEAQRPVATVLSKKTVTVWVNDHIDAFRVYPDNQPCSFRISSIALLVPASDGPDTPTHDSLR